MTRKIFSLVLSFAMVLSLFAGAGMTNAAQPEEPSAIPQTDIPAGGVSGVCGDNLTWKLTEDGTLTVSGTGEMPQWTLPDDVPWGEFYESITAVILKNGVANIGPFSFYFCSGLTSISIPKSVTSIGDGAFYFCRSLTEITIPAGVTSIGDGVFGYCDSLSAIHVESGNPAFREVDGVLFSKDQTRLCLYPAGKGGKAYTIPASVTSIGAGAFSNCERLTAVTIPEGVKSIGDWAFNDCASLTGITIPEGVTSIGYGAFCDCASLSVISIPGSVTSIEEQAFFRCTSLSDVYYPGTQEQWEDISIGDYNDPLRNAAIHPESTDDTVIASGECGDALTWTLTLGGKLTISGTGDMWNFYTNTMPWYTYCHQIKTLQIKNGAASIGDFAFYECRNLTSAALPEGMLSIGRSTFSRCESLADITFPKTLTSIGTWAFGYCAGLKTILLPESMTKIGTYAFGYCTGLAEITIPKGVTSIEKNTFEYCESLVSVTIPEGVTSIGISAFTNCTSLSEITIPESVTSIGTSVFSNCTSLAEITIPEGLTSIGSESFLNCASLTAIHVASGNAAYCDVDGVLFSKDKSVLYAYPIGKTAASYTILKGVTSIANWAFAYFANLTEITIPDTVKRIGYSAFSRGGALTDVYYGGTEEQWKEVSIGDYNNALRNAAIHYSAAEEYEPGDADGNGTINTTDVILVRRAIAGGYGVEINQNAADVDGNGVVNTTDVILMRRFIAGGYGVVLKPGSIS